MNTNSARRCRRLVTILSIVGFATTTGTLACDESASPTTGELGLVQGDSSLVTGDADAAVTAEVSDVLPADLLPDFQAEVSDIATDKASETGTADVEPDVQLDSGGELPEEVQQELPSSEVQPTDTADTADTVSDIPGELLADIPGDADATNDEVESDSVDAGPDLLDDTTDILADLAEPDVCVPDCSGKACGADGCGGDCGTCQGGTPYCVQEQCVAAPCPDGCEGAQCGCPGGSACYFGGCCFKQCDGKTCGPDGCGGQCGECGADEFCVSANCTDEVCTDGCSGDSCGCDNGLCLGAGNCCVPDCGGKQCGDDGCGGSCGDCGTDYCALGQCGAEQCPSGCEGLNCGCDAGSVCFGGSCCEPQCEGSECGSDQCGGTCGACPITATYCVEGSCSAVPCGAGCEGQQCGCPSGLTCHDGACCSNECLDDGTCGPTSSTCGFACACVNGDYCPATGGTCDPEPSLGVRLCLAKQVACAIRGDGEVECWGPDWTVQGYVVPPGPFVSLSCAEGERWHCGQRLDGSVTCWGNSDYLAPIIAGIPTTTPAKLSLGTVIACALFDDGGISCWGANPPAVSNEKEFTDLLVSGHTVCAIRQGVGSLECWGSAAGGLEIPYASGFSALHESVAGAFCATHIDGNVHCFTSYGFDPFILPSPAGEYRLVSGAKRACGLKLDHTIECAGLPAASGGTTEPPGFDWHDLSTYVEGISASKHATCGLDSFGQIHCWGNSNLSAASPPSF